MKKILISIIALSCLTFACSSSQNSAPAPTPSPSPSPSPSPTLQAVADHGLAMIGTDDFSNPVIFKTSDEGLTYTQITITSSTLTNFSSGPSVSGSNIAVYGQDANNNPALEVSTDNSATTSLVDISSLSAISLANVSVSGSNILFSGTDSNNNIVLELSTDFGQTFTQMSVPPLVAGFITSPDGLVYDGSSVLIRTANNGNLNFFYSTDLVNYTDITPQLSGGDCSGNEFVHAAISGGNILGSCLTIQLFTNSLATQTDLSAGLSTTVGLNTSNPVVEDNVAMNGTDIAVMDANNGTFVGAAISQDSGVTFNNLLTYPALPSHVVISTCFNFATFTPYPCPQTLSTTINTLAFY